jgi:acetyltransferase-like isoleucine patch superfamily enzyme
VRRLWVLLIPFLPANWRRTVGVKILGWDVHPTAYIGRSLIAARHVSLGPEAIIGPFNVFRDLEELRLARGANIGGRNWIAGHPLADTVFTSPNRRSSLIMGEWAKITVGHDIDCSDQVVMGAHAGIIGFRCQVLTHSLDLVRDVQVSAPVELGERSVVMSGCLLLSGTRVPARSIISAGSVVTTKLTKEQVFYRGNPAEAVRDLPELRLYTRGPEEERRHIGIA